MNGGSAEGFDDWGYHPDHQHTGMLVIDTVYGPSSRDNRIFPELYDYQDLEPWAIDELYLWRFSDIAMAPITDCIGYNETIMDNKLNALYLHESQVSNKTWLQMNLEYVGTQLDDMCGDFGEYAEAYMKYY